jgi:hypothetical protein
MGTYCPGSLLPLHIMLYSIAAAQATMKLTGGGSRLWIVGLVVPSWVLSDKAASVWTLGERRWSWQPNWEYRWR